MTKPINLKGKIQFVGAGADRAVEMKYSTPTFQDGFEESLTDTMMTSFENLKLTAEEKKQLSRSHRKILNYYRHLNPFSLNKDAKKLISEINQSKEPHMVIEANHYGAYICLAALYSGKLRTDKKIEFILEKAPLALFPKALIKSGPKVDMHKVVFHVSEDCWLKPFSSLCHNEKMNYSLKPVKKAS